MPLEGWRGEGAGCRMVWIAIDWDSVMMVSQAEVPLVLWTPGVLSGYNTPVVL